MDLVALQHVGSSQTRNQTCVPCIAGRFLSTEPPEKPKYFILFILFYFILFYFWPHCKACGVPHALTNMELVTSSMEAWSPNHWTIREVPQ